MLCSTFQLHHFKILSQLFEEDELLLCHFLRDFEDLGPIRIQHSEHVTLNQPIRGQYAVFPDNTTQIPISSFSLIPNSLMMFLPKVGKNFWN